MIASHPMYMLSILYCVPLASSILGDAVGDPSVSGGDAVVGFVLTLIVVYLSLFAHWFPWAFAVNGPLWFSTMYLWCCAFFPTAHHGLQTWPVMNLWKDPLQSCCAVFKSCGCKCINFLKNACMFYLLVFLASTGLGMGLYYLGGKGATGFALWFFFGYIFGFPQWVSIFMMGMVTYRAFEYNRRAGSEFWPYWGLTTDLISIFFFLTLLIQSATWTERDEAMMGKVWAVVMGGAEADYGDDEMVFPDRWFYGAAVWSRPLRACVPVLCVWIYGLAVGDGFTAKLTGHPFMVKYLSPAAYAMYLFHMPTAIYWDILVRGGGGDPYAMGPAHFVAVTLVTIGIALLVTHKLNAPATTLYQRMFPNLYQKCCCSCECCRCGCQGACFGLPKQEVEITGGTLAKLVSVIAGLSGAEVDGMTPLTEIGLDSFGASALVGVLRAKIQGLQLTAADVYALETVGDLAAFINKTMGVEQEDFGV